MLDIQLFITEEVCFYKENTMQKKIIFAALLTLSIFVFNCSIASTNLDIPQANLIKISKGELKMINLQSSPERIDIGASGIIDSFMQDDETMVIKGIDKGFTSIYVLYDNGKMDQYGITVLGATSALINGLAEQMKVNLAPIETIKVTTAGDKVIVSGTIDDEKYEDYYKKVVSLYSDYIVNMVKTPTGDIEVELPKGDKKEIPKIVQIDVKVVQVKDTDSTQLGIKWFANGAWQLGVQSSSSLSVQKQKTTNKDKEGANTYSDSKTKTGDYSDADTTDWDELDWARTQTVGNTFTESKDVPRVYSRTLSYSPNINLTNVNFELIALAEEGKVKLLATPKLIVQSGKTASFLVGGEIPIAQSTGFVASVDWKEYGTTLEISPDVLDNENIFIILEANLSELDWSNSVGNYPALLTKSAETRVTAANGETFAIAGLTSQDYVDTVTKVPMLGDIPLIGLIFRTKSKQIVSNETIIFFTPHILRKDDMYVQYAEPAGIHPSDNVKKYLKKIEDKKSPKAITPEMEDMLADAQAEQEKSNVQKLNRLNNKAQRFPDKR